MACGSDPMCPNCGAYMNPGLHGGMFCPNGCNNKPIDNFWSQPFNDSKDKFLTLKKSNDDSLVIINTKSIAGCMKSYGEDDCTIVYLKNSNEYVCVKESVEEIKKLLEES